MKKKVAIATWVGNVSLNYGSVLQSTAMQKLVRDCGWIPVTINHKFTPPTTKKEYRKRWKSRVRRLGSSYYLHWMAFSRFIHSNMKLSSECFSEEETIQICKERYHALLCGSDSIWNGWWMQPFFVWDFDELSHIPVIAYAVSFLRGSVTYENMSKALERFVGISGRENKVAEILKDYTDKQVETVLDPTLSVDEDFWRRLSKKRIVKEEYVICYFLSEAELHHISVQKIKKKYGVEKVIYINTDVIDAKGRIYTDYQGMDYKKVVGPTEFLSLFQYATAVCTDSFHGMCFSIVFRKDFYVYSREMLLDIKEDYRFSGLMSRLTIDNRIVNKNTDIETMSPINYRQVEDKLYEERKKSVEFLKRSLSKC